METGTTEGRTPGKLVAYCCVAREHWRKAAKKDGATTNTITVHERDWAFCPFDAVGLGHEWQATGGIGINELRWMVRRGAPEALEGRTAHRRAPDAHTTRPLVSKSREGSPARRAS